MVYSLATPDIVDLLAAARRILTDMITGQGELLAELQAEAAE